MGIWISDLKFWVVGIAALTFVFYLIFNIISKQTLQDPSKKAVQDKALLKKLLEDFGLEIPSELKDVKASMVKPIKTP